MLIQKEDRLSRPTEPARRTGYSRRRAPLNWQKIVRLTLYGMLGLLAGVAALACAALLMDRGGTSPASVPEPSQATAGLTTPPLADTPSLPPATVAPPQVQPPLATAPLPAPTPAPPPVAAKPAPPPPESSQLTALQAKIREADAQLAKLQAQAEKARLDAAEATRQREAAQAEAARQQATAVTAGTDDRRRAAEDAQAQREREAADAEARRQQAQQAQERADAAWADTEKRIQALAQPAPPPATPPSQPAAPAPTVAAPPEPSDDDAAMTPPPPRGAPPQLPASTARPLVFLHYRSGSRGAQQEATDIAQRLLFSDFAYADTRSAANVPSVPTVRYFYADDAAAAERLAASLAWTGQQFRVEDSSGRRRNVARGTLEIWIGG